MENVVAKAFAKLKEVYEELGMKKYIPLLWDQVKNNGLKINY
jgi:hypothetical protein